MSTTADTTGLAAALELEHVESHLHPVPSWAVEDHPEPKGREEIWRFTPLKRLRGLLAGAPSDGHLEWNQDVPAGVTITEISLDDVTALGGTPPLDRAGALAAANAGNAVLIDIAPEAVLDRPLRLTLKGTDIDTTVWGNIVVRIGIHAKATVLFDHVGSTTYAAFTSVLVSDGANLELVSLNDWDDDAVHLAQTNISVGRDATFTGFEFSLGGDLVRSTVNVDYRGPGGQADLYGVYFADAGQHLEHRQFVDHTAPKTRSNVAYKGALQGQAAHTVWIGNVLIRKVAEGIETYEHNDNLVLTDGAIADSVPNLEIETGNIEGAGHASTVGRFDDEHLFYLASRGIDEETARRLVVHGFFNDIIRRVGVEDVQARLISAIEDELEAVVGRIDPGAEQ